MTLLFSFHLFFFSFIFERCYVINHVFDGLDFFPFSKRICRFLLCTCRLDVSFCPSHIASSLDPKSGLTLRSVYLIVIIILDEEF